MSRFRSGLVAVGIVAATAALAGRIPADVPPNDCGHPYWAGTLRCQLLDVLNRAEPPQPNADDRPASLAELRDYTRVFMSNPTLRCLDGTRPALYVAPAASASVSNDWVISFTGGGACAPRDEDGDGVFEDGSLCSEMYPHETPEMSSALDPPMKDMEGGIMSRDPAANPVFAAFHSVRVDKCSYDRYVGRSEHTNVLGTLLGHTFEYTIFTHGQRIAEAAVHELLTGLRYITWADIDGDGDVDDVPAELPRLSDANRVLFIGHSNAAHGLRHNIDRLAQLVRRGRTRPVDVRAVLDANFLPSVEGEAAFAPALGGDAYTDQWSGTSTASQWTDAGLAGVTFSYDGETYHRTGFVATQLDAWKTALDESCVAAHPRESRWKCRDRQHVLFNHISTPMFIREDFLDPNEEHLDTPLGHAIPWALLPGCSYGPLKFPPECDVRFAPAAHRDRLVVLAETLLQGLATRSEIAARRDRSLAAGLVPSIQLWMPDCASHEGAYNDLSFHETLIADGTSALSYHDALVEFLAAPPFGHVGWRIVGNVNGVTMTRACP